MTPSCLDCQLQQMLQEKSEYFGPAHYYNLMQLMLITISQPHALTFDHMHNNHRNEELKYTGNIGVL